MLRKEKSPRIKKNQKKKHDGKHEKSKLISLYLRATLRASTCAPSNPVKRKKKMKKPNR
jgi:hypothetical protein